MFFLPINFLYDCSTSTDKCSGNCSNEWFTILKKKKNPGTEEEALARNYAISDCHF